ncbi:hypothetical protein [Metabacillus fastidiosus]|uniref:hypothetical protein n=1 Tax=Metabacillus fastidiosus TaxID=1458 RepID=UPI003D2778DB
MSKKKIAKFGLTAAVAATTVVAATPADAASVSATEKAVKQAAQSAGALVKYYSSTDIKVSGEFVTANNNARKAIANAKAALAKYNGKDKAQHEATVAKAEGQQLDAARYIDAEKLVKGELVNATKAVDAHVKAQTLGAETVTAYNKLSDTIKKAERVIGKVRGEQVRKAFGDKFLQDAKLTREALIYEVSQYQLLNKIAEKVAKDDFNGLDAELAKLDRLKERAVAIKEAGRKIYPGRTDVYPELPKIEEQLRSKETELRDKIVKASPLPAVASVKAINATTVEVAFKEAVKDIASVRFAIQGLDVKNAAVKQSDNKTVVITTSTQEGAKDYTLKNGGYTLGKFKGVSAVVPTKINLEAKSVSAVNGKEVTLKANIGVKEAGVPVTFNIDGADSALNKDYVAEVFTDENGIANYAYTQYNNAADAVAVYPTGAPSVRDTGAVYWNVKPHYQVEVKDADKAVNGSAKTYTVTVTNPRTGEPQSNAQLNVLLKENIDTVNGTTAVLADLAGNQRDGSQRSTGNNNALPIRTDANGKATFTVTGTNTSATPVIYAETLGNGNRFDALEENIVAPTVTFKGAQTPYTISITKDDATVAAVAGIGRVYTVEIKKPDGTPFSGGRVNLGFKELLDNDFTTNTNAQIIWLDNDNNLKTSAGAVEAGVTAVNATSAIARQLNNDGKLTFMIANGTAAQVATPLVWIDQDSATGAGNGILEATEPVAYGGKTTFVAQDTANSRLSVANAKQVAGQTTGIRFDILDQNGQQYVPAGAQARLVYTVENTGSNPIIVSAPTPEAFVDNSFSVNNGAAQTITAGDNIVTIQPGHSATIAATTDASTTRATLNVRTAAGDAGKYEVRATGVLTAGTTVTNLTPANVSGEFVNSTVAAPGVTTGKVVQFVTDDGNYEGAPASGYVVIELAGQPGVFRHVPYHKEASATVAADVFMVGSALSAAPRNTGNTVNADEFERRLSVGDDIRVTVDTALNDTNANTFELANLDGSNNVGQIKDTSGPAITNVAVAGTQVTLTFSEAVDDATVAATDFTLGGTAITAETIASVGTGATANDNTVVLTLSADPTPAAAETVTVALSGAGVVTDLNGQVSTQTAAVTFTQP